MENIQEKRIKEKSYAAEKLPNKNHRHRGSLQRKQKPKTNNKKPKRVYMSSYNFQKFIENAQTSETEVKGR